MVATYAPYPWGSTYAQPKPYYPPYTIPNFGPIAGQGPGIAPASAGPGAGQQLTPQGWTDDLASIVDTVLKVGGTLGLFGAAPGGGAMRPASAGVGAGAGPGGQLTPQGWFDDITSVVKTVIGVGSQLGLFNAAPGGAAMRPMAAGPAMRPMSAGAGSAQLTPQGWFDDVVSVVTKVAPIVIALLSTSPSGAALGPAPASVGPGTGAGQQLTPQGWFDDITSIVETVIKVGGALGVFNVSPNGSGLQTASTAATPQLTPQGWFDDVVSVVTKVAPIVISLLATSPSGTAMRPASAAPTGQLAAQGWTDDLSNIVNTVLQVGGALGLFNAPAAGQAAMPARSVN